MGSYGDEDYVRRPTTRSTPTPRPFFKPTPAPKTTPPPASASPTATKKAASVSPPVTTVISRPKGIINIVLGMDVSDSMGAFRENLKNKTQYLIEEIGKFIPDLVGKFEISVVGVSDHCDGARLLQPTGFTGDAATLGAHITSIKNAHGGDAPEAYECLFKMMNAWPIDGTSTLFLLVGDSVPHGMGVGIRDDGCPDNVSWEKELSELKKKLKGFYFISCGDNSVLLKKYQKKLVDDNEHFIELGGDFLRLTNVVHGILAKELKSLDQYLAHIKATRGASRATQIETLLKTKSTK